MRLVRHVFAVTFIVGTLVGCSGTTPSASVGGSPPESAAPSAPSGSAGESAAPSDGGATPVPSVATPEPIPSDELGAFSCDLPIVENASVALANITDVRVGTHDGYDRVVFEFEQGTPELTLDRATPPFTQDASGLPLDVDGSSFLRLTMRGGSKQTDEGTSSYDGPTDLDPGLPALVDLIEGGDFERQSTWYLGLDSEACVRVLLLDEPARVVIDVEHP
jgi:hypothetical protein